MRHCVDLEPTGRAIIKLYSTQRLSPYLCLNGLGGFRYMYLKWSNAKEFFRWSRLSCLHMMQTVKRKRVDVIFAFFHNDTFIVRTVLNETVIQKKIQEQCSVQIFYVLFWYHCHGWDGNHKPVPLVISRYIFNNSTCQFQAFGDIFGTNCTSWPFASRYRLNGT